MKGRRKTARNKRRRNRKTGSNPESQYQAEKGPGRFRKGLDSLLGFGKSATSKGKAKTISVTQGTLKMATNLPAFGKAVGTLVLAGSMYSLGSAAVTGLYNTTIPRGAPGLDQNIRSKLVDTDLGLVVQSVGMVAAGKIGASYLESGSMVSKQTADTMLAMLYGIVTYRALTGLQYKDLGSKFQYLADGNIAYALNPRIGPTMDLPSNVQNMQNAFNQEMPYSYTLERDFENRMYQNHNIKSALFTQQGGV